MKGPTVIPSRSEGVVEDRDNDDSRVHVRDNGTTPLLVSSPVTVEFPVPQLQVKTTSKHWVREQGQP